MPITIPSAAVAFKDPIVSLPARWAQGINTIIPPSEGARFIPFEIDWINYPNGVVSGNVQGNQSGGFNQMSQVVALSVDNLACGVDVTFIFPDTAEVRTVPAYTSATFPVFTNGTTFYVVATGIVASDITRFKCHNVMPPPVAFAATQEVTGSPSGIIPLNVNGGNIVIAATVNGVIRGLAWTAANGGGAAGACVVSMTDGQNNNIWSGFVSCPANDMRLLDIPGMEVRFLSGVVVQVASTSFAAGASMIVNFYYTAF